MPDLSSSWNLAAYVIMAAKSSNIKQRDILQMTKTLSISELHCGNCARQDIKCQQPLDKGIYILYDILNNLIETYYRSCVITLWNNKQSRSGLITIKKIS